MRGDRNASSAKKSDMKCKGSHHPTDDMSSEQGARPHSINRTTISNKPPFTNNLL